MVEGRFASKVVQTALGCTELHKRCVQEQGRFAWKVVQTALGCTELHKRCVQEQSSQSVKLSTNLRLVPRLKSRGTYCHFPIHFHREQLKMSFRAIFVPKFFFSGMWRHLLWQMNKDVFNLPTAFILWLFLHFEGGGAVGSSETSVPVCCCPPPNRPYA